MRRTVGDSIDFVEICNELHDNLESEELWCDPAGKEQYNFREHDDKNQKYYQRNQDDPHISFRFRTAGLVSFLSPNGPISGGSGQEEFMRLPAWQLSLGQHFQRHRHRRTDANPNHGFWRGSRTFMSRS